MANIKSQIKRNRQNDRRRLRNRTFRGTARTAIKDARLAIENGDVEQSKIAVKKAIKALDHAAEKGVIHKNNAARRKSRLMIHLSTIKPRSAEAKETESTSAERGGSRKSAAKKAAAVKKTDVAKETDSKKSAASRSARKSSGQEKSGKKTPARK